MAYCTMNYQTVCERSKSSIQRNERMRKEAESLKYIFKPVNTERLELLKKQYISMLNTQSKTQSNTIRLSLSSTDDEIHTGDGDHSDITTSSMDEITEAEINNTVMTSAPLPSSAISPLSCTLPVAVTAPLASFPSVPPTIPLSPVVSVPVTLPQTIPISTRPVSSTLPLSTIPLSSTLPAVSTIPTSFTIPMSNVPLSLPVSSVPVSNVPMSNVLISSTLPVSSIPLSSTLPVSNIPLSSSSTLPVSSIPLSSTLPVSSIPLSSTLPVSSVALPVSSVSLPVSNVLISPTLPVSDVPLSSTLPAVSIPSLSTVTSTSTYIPPLSSAPFTAVITSDNIINPQYTSSSSDISSPHQVTESGEQQEPMANHQLTFKNDNIVDPQSQSGVNDMNANSESESDFWDSGPQQPIHVVSINENISQLPTTATNTTVTTTTAAVVSPMLAQMNDSSHNSSDDDDDIDYSSQNITAVTISLLHTINTQVRKDHRLAKNVYESSSDIKSHIQHSTVLNSLLTKRAELGKDMMTWDTATLASVFLDTLCKIVELHGPPPLQQQSKGTSENQLVDEEGWTSLWPLILAHVRLLFQCGMLLDKIATVLSPILKTDVNTLLVIFQEECGAEIIFSLSSSTISDITEESNEEKFQAMYHSLVQSSLHTDDNSDESFSEGSAVAVLKTATTNGPFGGIPVIPIVASQSKDEIDDDETDGSLPLSDSPPPPPPPSSHKLLVSSSQSPQSHDSPKLSRSSSLKERRSGLSGIISKATLQRRLGNTDDINGIEEIISSPLSGPSVNSDDDDEFDFYQ